MRQGSPNSIPNSIRYALLALFVCALTALLLVIAKFSVLNAAESHAYWVGREGHLPFSMLPWSQQHLGGDALAMRLPWVLISIFLMVLVLLVFDRLVLRKLSIFGMIAWFVAGMIALGVQAIGLRQARNERHVFF